MQYPSTLQSGMKTRNPNKFFFFFIMTMSMTLMNVMSWKKEIERLIARDYLHQFIKKETKLEQDKKKIAHLMS
jgi:hypothetical protein